MNKIFFVNLNKDFGRKMHALLLVIVTEAPRRPHTIKQNNETANGQEHSQTDNTRGTNSS